MSRFDDLYWLVEVLDAGSFTAAAEKHNVSNAAVSKRIKLLEERLGVKLLIRSTRRIRATEAGELFYKRGKSLLDEFRELEQNVVSTSETLTGNIRVNAPLSFGLKKLVNPVNHFLTLYPDVTINMQLDDGFIDIQNNDYDLVIRIGKLEDSSIVAQRISSASLVCCASSDYLEKNGNPQCPKDLAMHNCMIYDQGSSFHKWRFSVEGQSQVISVAGNLLSNSGDLLADSVRNGYGVGYLPDFIIDESLKTGEVQTILQAYTHDAVNIYALYPSRHFLPLKIKRLIEFLKLQLNSGA